MTYRISHMEGVANGESRQAGSRAAVLIMAHSGSTAARYVRDVVIYTKFGQNYVTDAFNAAFSIPDFIYMLLVGGALSSAFIPVFSSYLATGRGKRAGEQPVFF